MNMDETMELHKEDSLAIDKKNLLILIVSPININKVSELDRKLKMFTSQFFKNSKIINC